MSGGWRGFEGMAVLGVEGSEKKCRPPPLMIISGTALTPDICTSQLGYNQVVCKFRGKQGGF